MSAGERALEALWALAESGDSKFTLADLQRRFGPAVNLLLSAGFLADDDNPRTLICRNCHAPHQADLKFCARSERWRYACVESGEWVEADGDAVHAVRFAPRALGKGVAAALSINKSPEERAEGTLWVLGAAKTDGVAWTAMIAHCANPAAFDAVAGALPLVSKSPGLVLTTMSVSRYIAPIANHRFSPLSHHLRMDEDGGLAINPDSIVAALGRAPASKRLPGRPTPRDEIHTIVLALSREEAARSKESLLALVRAKLPADAPPLKDQAFLGHIQDALKRRPKNMKT